MTRALNRTTADLSSVNRYDGARIESTFGELWPETAPRLRPKEVIGRVEEHSTVISHHRCHTPQDEIRDVNASARIIRFWWDLGMHAKRGLGYHEVESLMRKVTKEEQRITQTPVQRQVQRRDTLGGPPQALISHEAATLYALARLMGSGKNRWSFDPRVED